MKQVYAVNKETNRLEFIAANLFLVKKAIEEAHKTESAYHILGDIDMKYVSRIVYVDGNCVYNNCDFWLNRGSEILEDYESHDVRDILGNQVQKVRYETELNSNINRIVNIDGRPGEVTYNIEVANEMIALFKEECILTDFKGITPLEIAAKLAQAYTLVLTGSFREAKTIFQALETDPFLTAERKQKYIDMLDAADAIEYASDDELIYTTDPVVEPDPELVEYVRTYLVDQSSDVTYEHTFYYAALRGKEDGKPRFEEGDKLVFVIRHAERDSDGSSSTDINSTGEAHALSVGQQIAYGNVPSSHEPNNAVMIETNDAHYFSSELVRCKHTAQLIASGRGDTDSSASDYSGITVDQDLLDGYRFIPNHPSSGVTTVLQKYCSDPDSLTAEELSYFGVESAEEARTKLAADTDQFINEIINKSDKTLGVFVTSDYFVGALMAGVSNYGRSFDTSLWVDWCSGVCLIVHPNNTYDAFCVKCSKK